MIEARTCVLAAILALVLPSAAQARQPMPIDIKPVEITADTAAEWCASSPTRGSFVVGANAAAHFNKCVVSPGWPTALLYFETDSPQHPFALQLRTDTPPIMLGFDATGGLRWTSTRGADGRITRRLSVYRFEPATRSTEVFASIELPLESQLLGALEGERCWMLMISSAAPESLVLVAESGEPVIIASNARERPLFWDAPGGRFVVSTLPTANAMPDLSAIGCDGVRRRLEPGLMTFLQRYYNRDNHYFASVNGTLLWVSRRAGMLGPEAVPAAAFDLGSGKNINTRALLGTASDRVYGYAVSSKDRELSAVATDGDIRVLRNGRLLKAIPVLSGWTADLGFIEGETDLAVSSGFGINLHRMEN
ncbi:hypothetical protein [Luteimonas suaedae]|uniref:hypothetical protein n=1 Tax=Luteimonas suaedae TaxID=2605430 RepID=UPI0011EEE3AC|nr:hypothetical protein [Luteimonas suaedae]